MTEKSQKPKGWFLGLPYMCGRTLTATRPEKIPADLRNCDAIYCDDVLLSALNWRAMLKDWMDALKEGGHLILWLSDCRYIGIGDTPCVRITIHDIIAEFQSGELVESDIIDGHAYIVVKKTANGEHLINSAWRKKERHLLISRFGANGDAIMAATVLPALKAEGWTITMMVNENGYAMLANDPHIDEFLVFKAAQIQDDERASFWSAWMPRFDEFINMTHTVEGQFLKRAHEGAFYWPDDQRRALCAGSYLGFAHEAAGVPGPYRVKFYPTDAEAAWARKTKEELGKFVLWSLAGGAVHKWWPYVPQAICQLLAKTGYTFVLCGDDKAQAIANGVTQAVLDYFGDASRIRSLVAIKTLREAMALAQVADLVIGSETSVTNAVCLEEMPKIVFLSHSAPSNLTDDWVNTTALVPTSPCYPCHRLHANHDFCPQDAKTGAAACAASISVAQLVNAVVTIDKVAA